MRGGGTGLRARLVPDVDVGSWEAFADEHAPIGAERADAAHAAGPCGTARWTVGPLVWSVDRVTGAVAAVAVEHRGDRSEVLADLAHVRGVQVWAEPGPAIGIEVSDVARRAWTAVALAEDAQTWRAVEQDPLATALAHIERAAAWSLVEAAGLAAEEGAEAAQATADDHAARWLGSLGEQRAVATLPAEGRRAMRRRAVEIHDLLSEGPAAAAARELADLPLDRPGVGEPEPQGTAVLRRHVPDDIDPGTAPPVLGVPATVTVAVVDGTADLPPAAEVLGVRAGSSTVVREVDDRRVLSLPVTDDKPITSRWAIGCDPAGVRRCVVALAGRGARAEAEVRPGWDLASIEVRTHPAPPRPGSAITLLTMAAEEGRRALALGWRGEGGSAARLWNRCAWAWFQLGAVGRAGVARSLGLDHVPAELVVAPSAAGPEAAALLDLAAAGSDAVRLAVSPAPLWALVLDLAVAP